MPTYTYTCLEGQKGCGYTFEIYIPIAKYDPNVFPECPNCNKKNAVKRNFQKDISTTSSHIKTQTLGSLAEKNTNSMSEEARLAQWRKDNAYKFENPPGEPEMKLPKGAKHLRKPDDLKPTSRKKRKLNK